jgi:hypothetical protein
MEDNTTTQDMAGQASSVTSTLPKKKSASRLMIPIIAGIVLAAGVGAAAFNAGAQNSPDKIWKDALSNTAYSYDAVLADATNDQSRSLIFDGSFKLKSPIAADGQMKGRWSNKNTVLEGSTGLSGLRVGSEIRSIVADGNDVPDVYVYLDGLDIVQGLLGSAQPQLGSLIEQVNGQWIAIDRTLIDRGLTQLEQDTAFNTEVLMLSRDNINEISRSSAKVIKDYLLTTDSDKAVFQIADEQSEGQGEEEFEGVLTYKYIVTVNKDNLKSFAVAYKDALKNTQFDEYIASTSYDGETFEELIEFDQIIEVIDSIDFSETQNEAWVDLDNRLVRNIRISPTDQGTKKGSYIEFALLYDGGKTLPFTFSINSAADEKVEDGIDATFGAEYNQEDSSVALSFNIAGSLDGQDIDIEAELSITPSDEDVSVEKPTGAKNILEIVGQLQGISDVLLALLGQLEQFNFDL